MKYDQAGTYHLEYKAVDECGNETIQTRQIEVTASSDYPYVRATIGFPYIPTNINILADEKHEHEVGQAVITNFVVDGNNLGTVTVEVDAYSPSGYDLIWVDVSEWLMGALQIDWDNNDLSTMRAIVDNETELPTPSFSWDSIVITMTGEQ